MHELYLTDVPETNNSTKLLFLRAVRDALRVLNGPEMNATDASAALDGFKELGYVLLGQSDDPRVLGDATKVIEDAGGRAVLDLDDAIRQSLTAARSQPEVGSKELSETEPEEQPAATPAAYSTAMALMMVANGNPVTAAAYAAMLGRTTDDPTTYEDSIRSMYRTFPWLEARMKEEGLIT